MSEKGKEVAVRGKQDVMKLTKEQLQNLKLMICPLATDVEMIKFLAVCQENKLDWKTDEVYLIKYDAKDKAAIIVSVNSYKNAAIKNPHHKGVDVTVHVKDVKGTPMSLEQALVQGINTYEILGATAICYDDRFQNGSIKRSVAFSDYNRKYYSKEKQQWVEFPMWKNQPATQIEKVAIEHVLRDAGYLKDVYGSDEMGVEITQAFEAALLVEVQPEPAKKIEVPPEQKAALQTTPESVDPKKDYAEPMTEKQQKWLLDYMVNHNVDWGIIQQEYPKETGGSPINKLSKKIASVLIDLLIKRDRDK